MLVKKRCRRSFDSRSGRTEMLGLLGKMQLLLPIPELGLVAFELSMQLLNRLTFQRGCFDPDLKDN